MATVHALYTGTRDKILPAHIKSDELYAFGAAKLTLDGVVVATLDDVVNLGSDPDQALITAEFNARVAADAVITGDLATEVNARENGDTTLSASISSVADDLADEITDRGSAVSAEASTRASADTTLQTNITNEATARASADTTLQGNINSEASSRASADATLTTAVADEATARATGDTNVTNAYLAAIAKAGRFQSAAEVITSADPAARQSFTSPIIFAVSNSTMYLLRTKMFATTGSGAGIKRVYKQVVQAYGVSNTGTVNAVGEELVEIFTGDTADVLGACSIALTANSIEVAVNNVTASTAQNYKVFAELL